MALMKTVIVLLMGCLSNNYVRSHTYHFGQCPTLEPMTDFSMEMVSHKKIKSRLNFVND